MVEVGEDQSACKFLTVVWIVSAAILGAPAAVLGATAAVLGAPASV